MPSPDIPVLFASTWMEKYVLWMPNFPGYPSHQIVHKTFLTIQCLYSTLSHHMPKDKNSMMQRNGDDLQKMNQTRRMLEKMTFR